MMRLMIAPLLVLILISICPLAASAEEASIDCALFKNYSEESVGDFKSEPLLPARAGDEWVDYESAKKNGRSKPSALSKKHFKKNVGGFDWSIKSKKAPAPSPVSSGSSAPGH